MKVKKFLTFIKRRLQVHLYQHLVLYAARQVVDQDALIRYVVLDLLGVSDAKLLKRHALR